MTTAPPSVRPPATDTPVPLDWQTLLRVALAVTVTVLALAAVVLRDVEAAAVAAGLAVAFGLLHVRRGLAGQVLLCLLFTNVLFWMSLGAASNLVGGDGLLAQIFPAALTASSATGLLAALAVLLGRRGRPPSAKAPLWTAIAGVQVLLALLVAGALTGGWHGVASPDVDLAVVAENVAFFPDALTADAGVVSVSVANQDLFWHTFTVEELGVNLNVPVNGQRQTTFDAPPGTYKVICRIPGHERAGMTGTLVVR